MISSKLVLASVVALIATGCGSTDDEPASANTGATAGAAGAGAAGSGLGSAGGAGSAAGSANVGAGGAAAAGGGGGGGAAGSAAGAAGGAGAAGATCDVGVVPANLPEILGTFVQSDSPVKVPMTTGGDPKGIWLFDKQTTFLPEQAKGQVNEQTSMSVGKAWAAFDGTNFRVSSAFMTTLDVPILGGKIEQSSESMSRGSYTVTGDTFNFTPECSTADNNAAPPRFTSDGKTITFVLKIKAQQGTADIVLEGKLAP